MIQKFVRGDVVQVCKKMPSYMSHFKKDFRAIVLGSYASQYGGDNWDSLTLLDISDGNQISWYERNQLTFIRHIGERTLLKTIESSKIKGDKIRKERSCEFWKKIFGRRMPKGSIGRMYQDCVDKTILDSIKERKT